MSNDVVKTKEHGNYTINIYHDDITADDNPRTWGGNEAVFVINYPRYALGDRQDIEGTVNELFDKYISSKEVIDTFVKELKATKFTDDDGWGYEFDMVDRSGNKVHDSVGFFNSWSEDEVANELAYGYFSTRKKLSMLEDSNKVAILPISLYDHSGITIWLGTTEGHVDARWDCSSVGFAYVEYDEKRDGNKEDWKQDAYDIMEKEMKLYDDYVTGEVYGWEIRDENNVWVDGCGGYYGSDNFDDMISEADGIVDKIIDMVQEERKKNIQIVYGNLNKLRRIYCIQGYLYRVGKNMFGQKILEQAKIVNGVIDDFVEAKTEDLNNETLKELVSKIA